MDSQKPTNDTAGHPSTPSRSSKGHGLTPMAQALQGAYPQAPAGSKPTPPRNTLPLESAPPTADQAEQSWVCGTCRDAGYVKVPPLEGRNPWEFELMACPDCTHASS